MMPPPFYPYPPPPPRPPRSFARAIFTTLATTIFGLSILLNIYLLAFALLSKGNDGSARQTVLTAGAAAERIAIVPLDGAIMQEQAERFAQLLGQVQQDANVKALVIQIDTPGGSVTASDQIYHRIQQFKTAKPNVPVVISQGALATSGGYYASCAGGWIVAQPTTLTGNIGVLMPRFNVSKLADKWGIEDNSMHSTGADFKTAGSPFKEDTPQEHQYIQNLIDQAFTQFKSVVTAGRAGKLNGTIDQIANGKVYSAADALKLGLVDQIGYLDDATAKAAQLAGLTHPTVVKFQRHSTLLDLLSADNRLGSARAAAHESAVNVQVDGGAVLDALTTPRMLYLWRGR
jgi:protease-4